MPTAVLIIPLYGVADCNWPCTCSLVLVMSRGKVTKIQREESRKKQREKGGRGKGGSIRINKMKGDDTQIAAGE